MPRERRKPINPVSKRRRKRDKDYGKQRNAAYERADGLCEARCCPNCTFRAEQVHHIGGRGGGDPHALDNLLVVCAECHRHIEENRAEAYARGWLLRRNGRAA